MLYNAPPFLKPKKEIPIKMFGSFMAITKVESNRICGTRMRVTALFLKCR